MMQLPEGATSAAAPRFLRLCGWALYLLAALAMWNEITSWHMVSRPDFIRVFAVVVIILLSWIGTLLRRGRRTGVYWCGITAFMVVRSPCAGRGARSGMAPRTCNGHSTWD